MGTKRNMLRFLGERNALHTCNQSDYHIVNHTTNTTHYRNTNRFKSNNNLGEERMGYEHIQRGVSEVLQKQEKENKDILLVTEEIVCCEKDHPKVYINVPSGGKVMRCPYCNQGYMRE